MQLTLYFFILILAFNSIAASTDYPTFQQFLVKYSLQYNDPLEKIKRKDIYDRNIQDLQNKTCEFCGVTMFFASTAEEIAGLTGLKMLENNQKIGQPINKSANQNIIVSSDNKANLRVSAAASLDWRSSGKVTSVKSQGTCGTCWSFATAAMCESSLILQGRGLNNIFYEVDLSQQYLLKCTPNSTCSGGFLQNAIDLALETGLPYESKYPYDPFSTANNGICATTDTILISSKSRKSYYNADDATIINLLSAGPVAVAISAAGWQYYSSGIFKCQPNDPINHAVLLIGYDQSSWILKNQWGTTFGQNGYITITRNTSYNCGIGVAVHALHQNWIHLSFALLLSLVFLIK